MFETAFVNACNIVLEDRNRFCGRDWALKSLEQGRLECLTCGKEVFEKLGSEPSSLAGIRLKVSLHLSHLAACPVVPNRRMEELLDRDIAACLVRGCAERILWSFPWWLASMASAQNTGRRAALSAPCSSVGRSTCLMMEARINGSIDVEPGRGRPMAAYCVLSSYIDHGGQRLLSSLCVRCKIG
ncbi:hypothetical protein CC80DRAFT_34724 [Byssothecium circinans]|uniref:Uncharacterized protein n=1 Tax=Byssothecium circinans TaxID=147558 RepID=A0A6A5U1Y2_9PLEO|nr:hypothetical protein CC80DRAFT_34724 [Byssothecium circinans]